MGYKDENIKHRMGFNTSKPKYKCPYCKGGIGVKASFVSCPTCKKVVDGDDLITSK
ncbi:hypothetical protein Phi13:2_gp063 [Cellulophaga phage phi13:2]|uniref:Uncharacterized protein n=4 Tax=Pachyviridae TaxID=2946166 RepID=R9ZZQ9_9CAUD|nr:hypothetical protein Phi19:3_gp063 [Cellulophaga phage phi19:3]YP_008241102.1 hypothetical protein Phi46:3_gp059 [Cellulophaga phage phi46:3]YP_008241257.1 hypothetical protein Phi18:3_gp064 [Cellulophaga phage phi18:3]YP_008242088.1 hypothetical protein Phi13:2_gp063 [Cellulophaga phage phi13:2]AGO47467.1 hypothetical protein Phi19:3_gp063 [Cellulophaga phage phi19:3]AGO48576.1 hypothetical protein Phi18:3_gp064 [Cellulophaga phage phi18:3]AGO48803.1 hypothetical protein Phi46:3_gp059 [Ce